MVSALAGKKQEYKGRLIDPRYFFTNQYLIEQLQVTPKIERKCITIYGREERKRRQQKQAEQARREQGVLERKVYLLKKHEQAEANTERAKVMRASGMKVKDIAKEMGKSIEAVRSYLYRK
jgi:hypothetical protein